MSKDLNCIFIFKKPSEIHGMIDAHAYHGSSVTWPPQIKYVNVDGTSELLRKEAVDANSAISHEILADGVKERIDELVTSNTKMFRCFPYIDLNELKATPSLERSTTAERPTVQNPSGTDSEEAIDNEKPIPSLVIVSTMDMEFARFDGYVGKKNKMVNENNEVFREWRKQIGEIETTVVSYPLRLFPMFSYDPRRYSLFDGVLRNADGLEGWDNPFASIVGSEKSNKEIPKIWLGFCMNPSLGFRPFDERCEYLPKFYGQCAKEDIPILSSCILGGITTHDAAFYTYVDQKERSKKIEERHNKIKEEATKENSECTDHVLGSNMFCGMERVVNDHALDRFYKNYGHPRNWIPVLKYFPTLRLCLSGFGGSGVWQSKSVKEWVEHRQRTKLGELTQEWIRCVIKLTRRYENVYADISGLDIEKSDVQNALRKILILAQDNKNEEFCHLKHKLIFGSGRHLIRLNNQDDSNNMDYGCYCGKFKEFLDSVDVGGNGKLWEQVSFVNPWRFYGLSAEIKISGKTKVYEMYNELNKYTDKCDMLENMLKIIGDSSNRLVKYIAGCDKDYSFKGSDVETIENDDDLKAINGHTCTGECGCIDGSNITDIHEKLGCVHYGKIRDLIAIHDCLFKDNDGKLFGAKDLFERMIPYMRVGDAHCYNVKQIAFAEKNMYNVLYKINENGIEMQKLYCGYYGVSHANVVNGHAMLLNPYFTFQHKYVLGILTNIDVDAKYGWYGPYNEKRPTKFVRFLAPYQATIHELWHNIDCLAGKFVYSENGEKFFMPKTHIYGYNTEKGTGKLLRSLVDEFKTLCAGVKSYTGTDVWEVRHRDSRSKCYVELRENVMSEKGKKTYDYTDDVAVFYPFDILEGISVFLEEEIGGNEEESVDIKVKKYNEKGVGFKSLFPRLEYWLHDTKLIVASEYFAAVSCIVSVGDVGALKLMKNLLPQSYGVYREIIVDALRAVNSQAEKMCGGDDYEKFVKEMD